MGKHQAYAAALYEALRPDPFYAALEASIASPSSAKNIMLAYYTASIDDGANWGRLGEPVSDPYGVSVWSVPLSAADRQARTRAKHKALRKALGPGPFDLFCKIEASMAKHETALALQDHWYLSILGVAPAFQGNRLGEGLLRPVLEEADALGCASYLTTFSPRNISFYKRLGYVSAGSFPEPVSNSRFWVLVRQAG